MADFQLIKEQVTIEAAAQFLNLELRPMGAALRGPCPACKSGGDRAFDPAAFASKLQFTDEVSDLGISEDDA